MTGRNGSLPEDRDVAGGGRVGCVQIILSESSHAHSSAEVLRKWSGRFFGPMARLT